MITMCFINVCNFDIYRKSLQTFRGAHYDISDEINEIQEKYKSNAKHMVESTSWIRTLKKLKSSSFLKPFSCVGILYFMTEACGVIALITYMPKILEESISCHKIDSDNKNSAQIQCNTVTIEFGPIIVGSLRLIAAGCLPFFAGKLKPKLQFIVGVVIITVSYSVLGTYTYLQEIYPNSQTLKNVGWIPLITIVVPIVTRSVTTLPVLHALNSELYPTEIRTLSIGISQTMLNISVYMTVKIYPDLKNLMGLPTLCILYSIICLFVIIWGSISIPDNRGKSLVKVEEDFHSADAIANATSLVTAIATVFGVGPEKKTRSNNNITLYKLGRSDTVPCDIFSSKVDQKRISRSISYFK